MKIKDCMTKNVISVGASEPVAVAARLMSRYNLGALPVQNADGRLCGMVTDRDVVLRCVAARRDAEHMRVGAACATLEALGHPPVVYRRDGCTNGWVTCGQEKIPTIIFGAGHEKNAHVINETCPIDQILTACSFYAQLENEL